MEGSQKILIECNLLKFNMEAFSDGWTETKWKQNSASEEQEMPDNEQKQLKRTQSSICFSPLENKTTGDEVNWCPKGESKTELQEMKYEPPILVIYS